MTWRFELPQFGLTTCSLPFPTVDFLRAACKALVLVKPVRGGEQQQRKTKCSLRSKKPYCWHLYTSPDSFEKALMDMRVMRNEIQTASYIDVQGTNNAFPRAESYQSEWPWIAGWLCVPNFMVVEIPTTINLTVIGVASTNTAEDEMSCIDTISIPIILCNRSLSWSAFLMDNCWSEQSRNANLLCLQRLTISLEFHKSDVHQLSDNRSLLMVWYHVSWN